MSKTYIYIFVIFFSGILFSYSSCKPTIGDNTGDDETSEDSILLSNRLDSDLPFGAIEGYVMDEMGAPIEGATVTLYETSFNTITTEDGYYIINNIKAAAPRYILTVDKTGYYQGQMGNIDVNRDEITRVDFRLKRKSINFWYLDETLYLKFGWLYLYEYFDAYVKPADDAVLDADLYPSYVQPYLQGGGTIDMESPVLKDITGLIMNSLRDEEKTKQTTVAKKVYEWIVENIEHDTEGTIPNDVTTGGFQTNHCMWGRNYEDWLYTPEEIVTESRAICIETATLGVNLMRLAGIPARKAHVTIHPVTQWWVQLPDGSGYWSNFDASSGRLDYLRGEDIWGNFSTGAPETMIAYYDFDSKPIMHVDWYTENPLLFYELSRNGAHWTVGFEYSEEGLEDAISCFDEIMNAELDASECMDYPSAYQVEHVTRLWNVDHIGVFEYAIVLNLSNLGSQKEISFRFPHWIETEYHHVYMSDYWTNQPDWVVDSYYSGESNEETGVEVTFLNIDFKIPDTPPRE